MNTPGISFYGFYRVGHVRTFRHRRPPSIIQHYSYYTRSMKYTVFTLGPCVCTVSIFPQKKITSFTCGESWSRFLGRFFRGGGEPEVLRVLTGSMSARDRHLYHTQYCECSKRFGLVDSCVYRGNRLFNKYMIEYTRYHAYPSWGITPAIFRGVVS